MSWVADEHSWVVCAYGESPWLEDCIESLQHQTVPSRIMLVTSTPSAFLKEVARKYGLELRVNPGPGGIGGDWNFALKCADTAFVTLAHQDDLYDPEYTQVFLKRIHRSREPLLYFSGYDELRGEKRISKNRLLRVKRIMLLPIRFFPGQRWARRLSLSLGNPICCPAMTYRTEMMRERLFTLDMKSNLDWEMTERLSREKGSFVYEPRSMMCHRIHEDSTTSQIIGDHARTREDLEMFRKFWPEKLARRIAAWYACGEKSNQI